MPQLNNFSLVGGTALALRYGHRISVDLDLFSHESFDAAILVKTLEKEFKANFSFDGNLKMFGVFCYINDIKVDFVRYPHNLIKPVLLTEGIRMYGDEDIAAMKVNAVLGRGKKKDFWDLYELLKKYPLHEIIQWHGAKYPSQQLLISIPQAITYFTDADESEEPVSLKGQTWESVKQSIGRHVNKYLK